MSVRNKSLKNIKKSNAKAVKKIIAEASKPANSKEQKDEK